MWNWNKSGRIDTFEFEKVDNQDINVSLGKLECQVVGGSLTYSYYSDLKVSGTLEVINAPSDMAENDYLIRVWYVPTLDGETKRIELGTFYFTAELHYENGMYKGSLELRSLLARHIDDLTIQKWTLAKNKTISQCYLDVFTALGGFPVIDGIRDTTLTSAYVFDVGTAPIAILQYLADTCGGEIAVNTHGQTVLRNYRTPTEKAKDIDTVIAANGDSVVKAGMNISNSWNEIPNRVCCSAEVNGKQYVGVAALASDEPRSYDSIGRWITEYYQESNIKAPYADNLKKLAAAYLQLLNNKTIYYEFDCYYQPIEIGEVIELKYDDIVVKGLVSDIDLDLSIGAPMRVRIRKV